MLTAEERPLEGLALPTGLRFARSFEFSAHPVLAAAVGFLLIGFVGFADYLTGYDIQLAPLYLFPICMVTWALGGVAGTAMALAAWLSFIVSFASSHPFSHDYFFYWEGVAKVVPYLFIVWLIARLRRALTHSDERFVTVLDGLAAAVFVEDARNGQMLFANPRCKEKFGESRPAMLSTPLSNTFAGEVHDAATRRWYLVRSRPLRWIDGRAVTLRLLSDITEEKRVRELMERHRDALHQSSRLVALGEFASAIAHEINQPLTAIATYNNTCLRLLESGRGDGAELRQAMEKCRDQAKRAGAIIQRLRELLRSPSPAFGAQDLNEVARAARAAALPEALQSGVTLELALAPRLPMVRADALLIEQVLLNLVRNAIEAVQGLAPGRRRVTIASAASADGSVALSVADSGSGLAGQVQERLFHPFVSDKPGGLGLGLSICRSVIESHGGTIACDSGAQGARFTFTLPAAAA